MIAVNNCWNETQDTLRDRRQQPDAPQRSGNGVSREIRPSSDGFQPITSM